MAIRRPETVKRVGGAQHPLEQLPQAPSGAGRAFENGALGVHDLVTEDGEKQARLVAGEGVDAGSRMLDRSAAVVALRTGRR